MGAFDTLGQVGSGINTMGLGPLINAGANQQVDSSVVQTPQASQLDNQVSQAKQYASQLNDQAKAYRQNLQGVQAQYMSSATDQARNSLAGNLAGNAAAANSRGLLYSGVNQGGQAGAVQDYATGLGQAQQNINAATLNQAQQYDAAAQQANMGAQGLMMGQAQYQQQAAEDSYQAALKQQQAQAAGYQQAGSAIGGLFGSVGGLLAKAG